MEEEKKTQNNIEDNLFDKMSNVPDHRLQYKRFERSKGNFVIAGVCSGIANYFNADPANVRVIALLSLLFGGWSIVAYSLMAFLMPVELNPRQLTDDEKARIKKENSRTVIGGLLILIGLHLALLTFGIGSRTRIFLFSNYFVFPIGAILLGIFLLTKNRFEQSAFSKTSNIQYQLSRSDKIFFGVCGGLSKHIGVDSSFIRIIFLLASFLTLGIFTLLYFIIGVFAKPETEINFE